MQLINSLIADAVFLAEQVFTVISPTSLEPGIFQ